MILAIAKEFNHLSSAPVRQYNLRTYVRQNGFEKISQSIHYQQKKKKKKKKKIKKSYETKL